jgi:large subunit ribosomal protein L24
MQAIPGKTKIKKDDIVQVISGREKGKKGKVLSLLPQENRILVEKLNMFKRHMKGDGKTQQAGIVEREGKMDISNVALYGRSRQAQETGRRKARSRLREM